MPVLDRLNERWAAISAQLTDLIRQPVEVPPSR
jgi:hypothetical protein